MSISKRPVIFVTLAVVVAALTVGAPIAGADPWFNDRSSAVRPDDRAGPRGPGALASTYVAQRATRPDDRAGARGPGAVASSGATSRYVPDAADLRKDEAPPIVVYVDRENTASFDWLDALIGALATAGVALAVAGLLIVRQHSPILAR